MVRFTTVRLTRATAQALKDWEPGGTYEENLCSILELLGAFPFEVEEKEDCACRPEAEDACRGSCNPPHNWRQRTSAPGGGRS